MHYFQSAAQHFKERMSEWLIGFGLFAWGCIVISRPGYFETTPALANMINLAPQEVWGWAAGLIGLTRLVFLFINGTWRRSAHLRAIGSSLSATFWAAVLSSYTMLGAPIPNLATIGALLALDIAATWFAAEDAKRSDIRIKEDRAIIRGVRGDIT